MLSERSQTRIIENPEEIIRHIRDFTMNSAELSVSFATGGMQFNYTYLFDLKKKILEKHRRGEHKGLRYISNIDNSNAEVTKKFLDAGANIKHVKNLPPMSFGVSDKEMITTIEKMEKGGVVSSILVSNDFAYINHFNAIFEELWRIGIDAADRIMDIEQGNETDDELADAKRSLNEVLEEVTNMKESVQHRK